MNIREECFKILKKANDDGVFVAEVLGNALRVMQFADKRDRAFLTRLVEGTVERRISLDYLIDKFSKKAPDSDARIILRMGIYQIKYMESIPDRAAISESVELCKTVGLEGRSGYVNAVLRKVATLKEEKKLDSLLVSKMEVRYSTPKWICDLLVKNYGKDNAKLILEDQFKEHDTVIRINSLKTTVDEIKERLTSKGVTVKDGALSKRTLRISDYDSVTRLPGFRDGHFIVQDETSVYAIEHAGIKPGDRILDMCSAPGGKSLLAYELASSEEKAALVTSCDISEAKLEKIRENAERLGIPCGDGDIPAGIKLSKRDATEFIGSEAEKYDVVIADVPCSGLGVMGRKNDIKYNTTEEGAAALAKQGLKILTNASRYVNQNGRLIFSTCTINPEENERVVDAFLSSQKTAGESEDSKSEKGDNTDITDNTDNTDNTYARDSEFELVESRTFLQGIDGSDGFFYAVLKKIS